MASLTHSSQPEIPDNHKESWLALLSAAETYCQKSGCDLAILTACKKFRSTAGEGEGGKKRESGTGFPKECEFSYSVWGQGFLAESARRYMDDIGVLHATSMLTAQKHTRQTGRDQGGKLLGDGVIGGVSPNSKQYSQNYPSIYSPDGTTQQGVGLNGNRERERERSALEVERGRQSAGIVEEEGEEVEEEEDMDERRPYGNESA
ncbi:hypothetical protein GOODEAATRI_032002, partial [Goodea atripinnis]